MRLAFAYDAQGRRIGKKVWRMGGGPASASGGGILVLRESWRFVYDGWNMIGEFQVPVVAGAEAASAGGLAGCALRRSYQWGLDVSGTLTGAGGVGGLLAVHRHGAGAGATATGTATMTGTFLPCYDGNGNVTELVNWTSTTVVSARYEYSPFGETVLLEGEAIAGENPFRFSTKYTDGETGLVYYGYRYYAQEVGRWLARDPIGERGGLNLYGMVENGVVNKMDRLGLEEVYFTCKGESDKVIDEEANGPVQATVGGRCCLRKAPYWSVHYTSRWECIKQERKDHTTSDEMDLAGASFSAAAALLSKRHPTAAAAAGIPAGVATGLTGGSFLAAVAECEKRVCDKFGKWVKSKHTAEELNQGWIKGCCLRCEY